MMVYTHLLNDERYLFVFFCILVVLFTSQVIMKGKVSAVDVSIYLASEMKMLGGVGGYALGFLGS